jgi:hypothetical protein
MSALHPTSAAPGAVAAASAGSSRGLRCALPGLVAGALVLLYLWPFRLYGLDIVDEGTLLTQIARVASGERPYVDFHTGYTPGYFALEAALWRLPGLPIVVTRSFGLLVHAATAGLVFGLARRRASRLLAACLTLLDVAFLLPVSLRFGAPFNIPYPGWLAAPLAVLAGAAVAGLEDERRRILRVALAGVAAGGAFLMKPNSGGLALGGAALALAGTWPAESRLAVATANLVRGAAVVCAAVFVWPELDLGFSVGLLLPVVLAAWRMRPEAAVSSAPGADELPGAAVARSAGSMVAVDLLVLGGSFLAVILPWLLPLVSTLGGERFSREVLLLGAGVEKVYFEPFDPPLGSTLAIAAGLTLATLLAVRSGARGARGDFEEGGSRLAPLALVAGLAAAALARGDQPARLIGENACLWLGPLALTLGLLGAARRHSSGAERGMLAFAAIYQLELYPRVDLIHVAMGAPPLLVALAWQGQRVVECWRGRDPGPGGASPRETALARPLRGPWARLVGNDALASLVATLVAVLALARMAPTWFPRLAAPAATLDAGPRAPLLIDARYAHDFAWLGEAVRRIESDTRPGEPIFLFPDLAVLAFLADRPAPFFYDYFVPGRPDHAGEQEVLSRLESVKPRLAAVGAPRVPAFRDAPTYFADLSAYIAATYTVRASLDGCDLLWRRDEGEPPSAVVRAW